MFYRAFRFHFNLQRVSNKIQMTKLSFSMKLIRKLYVAISDPSAKLSVVKMPNVDLTSDWLISSTSGFTLNTLISNIVRNVFMTI